MLPGIRRRAGSSGAALLLVVRANINSPYKTRLTWALSGMRAYRPHVVLHIMHVKIRSAVDAIEALRPRLSMRTLYPRGVASSCHGSQ
jgi:hypothetical protein